MLFVGLLGAPRAHDGIGVASDAPAGYLRVDVVGDAVTVEARDVTVGSVLEGIAGRAGLEVDLHDSLDARVSMAFGGLTLDGALKRVLADQSYVLRYAGPASARQPARRYPNRLWVFPSGSRGGSAATDEEGAGAEQGALERALTSEDPNVRVAGVLDLTDAGGDRAAAALAAAALSDPDARVREEAVRGLGELGRPASIEALEQALLDPEQDVREAVIEALTDIGGAASAWALVLALGDQAASLREDAVYALGEIGGDFAVDILRQALADEEAAVREAAEETLAELTD